MSKRHEQLPGRPRDEIADRMRLMKQELYESLLIRLRSEIAEIVSAAVADAMRAERRPDRAIARVDGGRADSSRELATMTKDITVAVYDKVLCEINQTLVPQINQMGRWVNFNMQDGDQLVDIYRRRVEHQSSGNTKMLTAGGSADKRVISPHIRTMFGEDSD